MLSIPTVMMSYHRRGFFQMCICFIQEFKVQNQSHRAHYSQGFCQRKNCNTVIFPAAPPSVPAVRGPPQGRSKKVVTSKTHNEHCPAYLAPDHGLLYIWTELLYLTCPHEADLFPFNPYINVIQTHSIFVKL